jgi:hypothetical protein
MSCAAAGYCTVAGTYVDGSSHTQAYVDDEFSTWDDAIAVPGLASLTASLVLPKSVSCSSGGDCVLVGTYVSSIGPEPFVVRENGAVWGTAIEAPGAAAINVGGDSVLQSVSCYTNGNCSAVGYFLNSVGVVQPMVITQTNGVWGNVQSLDTLPLGGSYSKASRPPFNSCRVPVRATASPSVEQATTSSTVTKLTAPGSPRS